MTHHTFEEDEDQNPISAEDAAFLEAKHQEIAAIFDQIDKRLRGKDISLFLLMSGVQEPEPCEKNSTPHTHMATWVSAVGIPALFSHAMKTAASNNHPFVIGLVNDIAQAAKDFEEFNASPRRAPCSTC